MKRLKSVHISILTIVVFVAALILGMQSDWWVLSGRRTPLDSTGGNGHSTEINTQELGVEYSDDHGEEEEHGEEDHETDSVSGGSTVQNALDLGISLEDLEKVLEGKIDNTNAVIKTIVTQRGLKFGVVKDTLNALIGK